MNILFITIAWPEKGKRNLYTDLINKFVQEGHTVNVVTNRPRKDGKSGSFDLEDGIQVLRIKTGNIAKTNPLEKSLSLMLLGRQFKQGIDKHLGAQKIDLILFNTPPITLSHLLKSLKEKYDCPLYLLLKDIWPYGFADMGLIKKNGWIYNYFRKHEIRLYKLATVIGCMSPKGVDFVLEKNPYLDPQKVEVCPNSIQVKDGEAVIDIGIRNKFGIPHDATVFIFSGNLGLGHGLDFLNEAILQLKDYEKAFFLIGGAGTYFDRMKDFFEKHNLSNALLYSYLPDDEYRALIGTCDVGLVLLDHKYSYPQFPSRLLSYLENKMAVLCAVTDETDIGNVVKENEVGLSTTHGDVDAFKAAVRAMCENKTRTKHMGMNGFELLKQQYDVSNSYQIIMNHFNQKALSLNAKSA